MADKIRFQIEKCLPDLLALQKRKIFSEQEIKDIVSERENYEYILQRRTHGLKDYMKLLDYEYSLERIRRAKVEDLNIKKLNERDFTIVKRIIQIWDRIMNKYRYRIELWEQYLCFCYTIGSKKQFFKVITNALKFNPFAINLWVIGATYEFQVAKNPFKARKIYYQAIKINNKSIELWSQYLEFELDFMDVLQQRNATQTKTEGFIGFQEAEQQLVNSDPKISGIVTIIELAIESCSIEIYPKLLEILKDRQSDLYNDVRSKYQVVLQKLIQSNLTLENAVAYLKLTIESQEQALEYASSNQNSILIQALFSLDFDKALIAATILHNLTTVNDLNLISQLIKYNQSHDLQVKISNSDLNNFTKLKYLKQLKADKKLINSLFSKTLTSLSQNKDELADQLIYLLDIDIDRVFNVAKTNLLTSREQFTRFIDDYFAKIHNNKQLTQQTLNWLIQQRVYCPLKYQLQYLDQQQLSVQQHFMELQKLCQIYQNVEIYDKLIRWTAVNYPEKSTQLLTQIEFLPVELKPKVILVQSAVVELSIESAEQIFTKGQIAIVLFYRNKNTFAYEIFNQMNSSLLSVNADVNQPLVQKLMKILDIQEFQIPSIKIISANGPTVDDIVTYTYDDSLEIAKLQDFTKNYTAYEDIHSEIIPSSSVQDGIHIVVGYTYESFINDDKRITLMYYYDDECNLCETMLQSLIQLNNVIRSGKSLIKPSRFKIGKINQKNKIRDPIRQYPSLRLFINNSYINYDGDRTTEGMLAWVSQQ